MDPTSAGNDATATHTVGGRPVNTDGHRGHPLKKPSFGRDARLVQDGALAQDGAWLMTGPFHPPNEPPVFLLCCHCRVICIWCFCLSRSASDNNNDATQGGGGGGDEGIQGGRGDNDQQRHRLLHRRAGTTAGEVEMVGKKDDHDKKEEKEKLEQGGGGATTTPFTLFDQKVSCVGCSHPYWPVSRRVRMSQLHSLLAGELLMWYSCRQGGQPHVLIEIPCPRSTKNLTGTATQAECMHTTPSEVFVPCFENLYSHRSYWTYPAAIVSIVSTP